jgi:hypothetical protein
MKELASPDSHQIAARRVHILLSTYNGERFLGAQLGSLMAQTHLDWILYWRDDGSCDSTLQIMRDFAASAAIGRCVWVQEPSRRLGAAASFMTLLRAAISGSRPDDRVAFMDQDDIWLPEKLARGLEFLAGADERMPELYCGRVIIVDRDLRRLGVTKLPSFDPGFPASLTQNIATGCTIMLNRRAAHLVADSTPPRTAFHDWWCYLLVTAAGGQILIDNEPMTLYRQHGDNAIGMPLSTMRRAVAALRRGHRPFMFLLREHLMALATQQELICPRMRPTVLALQQSLHGGRRQKLAALRTPGFTRLGRLETLIFRLWFLIDAPRVGSTVCMH